MTDAKIALFQSFTTRQLRRIANSSTTAGRFNWEEIAYAAKLVREREA